MALIVLLIYFRQKNTKKRNYPFTDFIFLTYSLPLLYGYLIKPIIFPKYNICFNTIILIISHLIFFIEKKIVRNLIIFILIFFNLANHFSESTVKQFVSERQRFNPYFEKAFEIIDKSENKKLFIIQTKLMMKT